MSDVDGGNVKAKASIEYDPSGMKQFKEDLASLPSMVGGLGQSAGQAGSELENLDKGMAANAESAKSFTSAISELPKMVESGTSAVSGMSGVLSEQRSALEETASAHETLQKSVESTVSAFEKAPSSMQSVAEHAQSLQAPLENAGKSISQLSESITQIPLMPRIAGPSFDAKEFGFDIPTENLSVFQDALVNPEPFNLIQGYLGETGQAWGDFFSSIGKENVAQLSNVMSFTTPTESRQFMEQYNSVFAQSGGGPAQSIDDLQKLGDTIWATNDAAKSTGETLATLDTSTKSVGKSAQVSAEQFSTAGKETGQWVETSNGFMAKLGDVMEGPAYSKPVSLGGAFSEVLGGVTGMLNDIAMPLMAVQMIGQVVGQVGQAMYDAAAIAEGPAAHSFGTFTGTVDALGQSLQRASGQFSEGFGQAMLPTLNALNSQASSGDLGGLGQFLGGIGATLTNLSLITTGIDPMGGIEGLINQGASLIGLQQPFQGPPPEEQAQIQYRQQMAALPQTVRQNAQQLQYQANLTMAEATDPNWLAQNNLNTASQSAAQYLVQSYNTSHPIPRSQLIAQAQEQRYDTQQLQNYQYQMANQPSWLQTIGDYWSDALGISSAPKPSNPNARSAAQSYGSNYYGQTGYGGGEPGVSGGGGGIDWGGIGNNISGFFGGIGNWFQGLFGGGTETPTGPVPISTGGCFVSGTPVLMADGSSKPIEVIQVDERVLSYDGTKQVPATVIACISYPAKQTYELTFSDGKTLTTTDSHPLAGVDGWKSISPASTAQENPGLPVTALQIGDDIYTADGTLCRLLIIEKRGIERVYNITVDTVHTYYAGGVLVHNAKQGNFIGSGSLANDGTGSEQVQVSHTFVANVQWEANNLTKQFTGMASWVGQNLANTFQGAASWVAQGLSNTFQAATTWVAQGLSNTFNGVANWVAQGLSNTFNGVANWVGENLANTFQGVASWAGEGLSNTFKGIASWVGSGLEHTFNAVANWTAQNLSPNFTVNPSFTMLAEGTSNWGGGPAIVGEAGPEVVEHNGQYSMFDAGASLVNLPPGANVYPMKNLGSGSVAQFADGTGGNYMLPLNIGIPGGGMPQSFNLTVQLGENASLSAMSIPFAQDIRVSTGNRSY